MIGKLLRGYERQQDKPLKKIKKEYSLFDVLRGKAAWQKTRKIDRGVNERLFHA